MKKVLILACVAIGMIGLTVFYLFGNDTEVVAPVVTQPVSSAEESPAGEPLSGISSLAQLQTYAADLECQISYDPASGEEITGTLFLSNANLRADFLMNNIEFGEYAASVIVLPDYTYSWSQIEGNSYGVRLPTTSLTGQADGNESGLPLTLSDPVRYDCEEWESVDGSVFTPPVSVLFRDAAAVEAAGMEYGTIYEE